MSVNLTILVPFYNEADGLESCVEQLHAYLSAHGHSYELLLVDDHSSDGSSEIGRRLYEKDPRVRYHRHPRNYGPCSALRTGPALASGEWTLLLPVDLAIPLGDISSFWNNREGSDIVLGYIEEPERRERARLFQSRLYTLFIRMLFGHSWPQINYVALYRTSLLQSLKLESKGVALHAEILIRAAREGAKIRPLAVGYAPRTVGVARGSRPGVILGTIWEILRLWWRLKWGSSPPKTSA